MGLRYPCRQGRRVDFRLHLPGLVVAFLRCYWGSFLGRAHCVASLLLKSILLAAALAAVATLS